MMAPTPLKTTFEQLFIQMRNLNFPLKNCCDAANVPNVIGHSQSHFDQIFGKLNYISLNF